jgi:hypothetical protein
MHCIQLRDVLLTEAKFRGNYPNGSEIWRCEFGGPFEIVYSPTQTSPRGPPPWCRVSAKGVSRYF